jgi:hypothetical protein
VRVGLNFNKKKKKNNANAELLVASESQSLRDMSALQKFSRAFLGWIKNLVQQQLEF